MNSTYLRINEELQRIYGGGPSPTRMPNYSNHTTTPYSCHDNDCIVEIILLSLFPCYIICCGICCYVCKK
jgi:hypothetical protein